jgi:acetyl-CoA acetyltransferase
MSRDVAIVSFAEAPSLRREWALEEVEMLVPVITEAIERSGIPRREIGFTCSGSSDFLTGRPFSFVIALDAVGAFPPIEESHVEMDGAWALYEAWVRLSHGDIDAALVYAFGRSSLGEVRDVLTMQLDPYYVAPLWPDSIGLAALQARALLDAGRATERAMAEVAARSRQSAADNPFAQLKGSPGVDALLREPYLVSPLRRHDCPPISDGACAVVLAAGDRARKACRRPAWIRGIDHRIEAHSLGARDLTRSPSTALAAERAGVKSVV